MSEYDSEGHHLSGELRNVSDIIDAMNALSYPDVQILRCEQVVDEDDSGCMYFKAECMTETGKFAIVFEVPEFSQGISKTEVYELFDQALRDALPNPVSTFLERTKHYITRRLILPSAPCADQSELDRVYKEIFALKGFFPLDYIAIEMEATDSHHNYERNANRIDDADNWIRRVQVKNSDMDIIYALGYTKKEGENPILYIALLVRDFSEAFKHIVASRLNGFTSIFRRPSNSATIIANQAVRYSVNGDNIQWNGKDIAELTSAIQTYSRHKDDIRIRILEGNTDAQVEYTIYQERAVDSSIIMPKYNVSQADLKEDGKQKALENQNILQHYLMQKLQPIDFGMGITVEVSLRQTADGLAAVILWSRDGTVVYKQIPYVSKNSKQNIEKFSQLVLENICFPNHPINAFIASNHLPNLRLLQSENPEDMPPDLQPGCSKFFPNDFFSHLYFLDKKDFRITFPYDTDEESAFTMCGFDCVYAWIQGDPNFTLQDDYIIKIDETSRNTPLQEESDFSFRVYLYKLDEEATLSKIRVYFDSTLHVNVTISDESGESIIVEGSEPLADLKTNAQSIRSMIDSYVEPQEEYSLSLSLERYRLYWKLFKQSR